jgi:hypothetical protein
VHGLDIAVGEGQRHGLNRLALQVEELAVEVGQRPVALLGAAKERSKLGVVGDKVVSEGLDIGGSEVDRRRATRGRWPTGASVDNRSHSVLLPSPQHDLDHLTL